MQLLDRLRYFRGGQPRLPPAQFPRSRSSSALTSHDNARGSGFQGARLEERDFPCLLHAFTFAAPCCWPRTSGAVLLLSSEKSSTGAKAATRDLSIDDEFHQCYPGEVAFDEYSFLVMFKDATGKPLSDATLASLASAQEQIAALSDYQVSILPFTSMSSGSRCISGSSLLS